MNDCVITSDYVNRAEDMFGPSVPCLEGHMIRRKPQESGKIEKTPLPHMIKHQHLNVALAMCFSLQMATCLSTHS